LSPLNIHPEADVSAKKRKNNKALKILLGIGALIAVPAIGSTLAAQITIGGGTAIQFGQGVQQATACDDAITVTANASFDNTSTAGRFNVGSIVLGGVADECSGKKFTVRAFGDSDDTQLTLGSGGSGSPACVATPTLAVGANSILSEENNNCIGTVGNYSVDANVITFTPNAATLLDASTVYKFTVETSS
jgi:hypothetical protein